MPDLNQGARCLVSFIGSYFGQRTVNTFLYKCTAVSGSVDSAFAVGALLVKIKAAGGLAEAYAACVPRLEDFSFSSIWGQIIYPVRLRATKVPSGVVQSNDVPSTTPNVSASITRFGANANRKNIGGIRVPVATEQLANGLIGDTLLANLIALADQMVLPIPTTTPAVTWTPQVGLPGYAGNPPAPISPVNSVDCVNALPAATARVMHRRTVGVGK